MTTKTSLLSPVTIHTTAAITFLVVLVRANGAVCSLMYQCGLLFEDHGVCSGIIADSLALKSAIYERRALVQPLPSALQFATRARGTRFFSDLVVTSAFRPHTSKFSLQVLDLTHVWSHSDSNVSEHDDILALTAAIYVFIKLNLSPQQRYPRTLPELLTAFAELLTRQQPDDVPVLHDTSTIRLTQQQQRQILHFILNLSLLCQSNCRDSRPELPLQFSFSSQSDWCHSLVYVCSVVGITEFYCRAMNLCQRVTDQPLVSPICSCLLCSSPHHFTLLLPHVHCSCPVLWPVIAVAR